MIFKKKSKDRSPFNKDSDVDWNLNWEFVQWLRYWCKKYLEKADSIINLDYHIIDGHTQREAIEHLIDLCDRVMEFDLGDKEQIPLIDEIFDLFHKLFWYMWW